MMIVESLSSCQGESKHISLFESIVSFDSGECYIVLHRQVSCARMTK